MKFLIFYRGKGLWPQKSEKVLGGVKLVPYSEFQTNLLFLAFDLSLHLRIPDHPESFPYFLFFSLYLLFIGHCFGRFQGENKCILLCSNEKSSNDKLFEPLRLFLNW